MTTHTYTVTVTMPDGRDHFLCATAGPDLDEPLFSLLDADTMIPVVMPLTAEPMMAALARRGRTEPQECTAMIAHCRRRLARLEAV